MAKYEDQCGSCEYFYECRGNWDKPYNVNDSDKGYCEWYKTTYYPDDSCNHYNKRGSYHGGCYITTIVCNILGFDDNCEVLNNLRKLRDNFMQKKEEYKNDLYEYDKIGPQISVLLYEDYKETDDDMIAKALYYNFLVPAANQVKENNYIGAIDTYKNMTSLLKNTYNIKVDKKGLNNYDYKKGGHGYIKTREA